MNLTVVYNETQAHTGPDSQEIGFGVLYGLTILFGLIGNAMVLLAVLGDAAMRKTTINRLILSLATADFLNLLCVVPDVSFQLFSNGEWVGTAWMCPLTRSLQNISLAASVFGQVCIAVERFWAIVYPMFAKRIWQSQASVFTLLFIWFFSIMFNLLTILKTKLKSFRNDTIHRCVFDLHPDYILIYRTVGFLVLYFIPLVIILFVYSCSFRQLNKAMELWLPKGETKGTALTTRCSSAHGSINKGRKRTLLMLAMCAILYLVCYSPIQLMLIAQYVPKSSAVHRWIRVFTGNKTFKLLVHALVLVNSAGNPAMYALFSNRYRARFSEILRCRHRHSSRNNNLGHKSMDYTTTTKMAAAQHNQRSNLKANNNRRKFLAPNSFGSQSNLAQNRDSSVEETGTLLKGRSLHSSFRKDNLHHLNSDNNDDDDTFL